VDFITIHILPYWEDEPIPVDAAALHIERAYQAVKQEAESIAPGKPILIGESGWPSQGRQRGRAVPSVVNAARFMRGLIKSANENGFDYNIVEAFNQQWKSQLEGVVGANWGLFSEERKQIIPLTGPVLEHPYWSIRWLLATVLFIAMVVGFRNAWQGLPTYPLVILLGFVQLLLVLLVAAADDLWFTSYNVWQRLHTLFLLALNALTGGLIVQRAYRILRGTVDKDKSGPFLYMLYLLFVALAVYKTYGFVVWGRYLSFPSAQFVIPVAGLSGLILIYCMAEKRFSRHAFAVHRLFGYSVTYHALDKLVGIALVFIGLAMLYGETRAFMLGRDLILAYPDVYERLKLSLMFTLSNGQLLVWFACLLVLALPFLFAERDHGQQDQQRTS
jgi:hypothetical protein